MHLTDRMLAETTMGLPRQVQVPMYSTLASVAHTASDKSENVQDGAVASQCEAPDNSQNDKAVR